MKITNILLVGITFLILLFGCDNDDPQPVDPTEQRLTEGYIVTGTNADRTTTFARYFAELPTGTIDLTEGQAFPFSLPYEVFDGAVYMQKTGGFGLVKLAVNGNGEFVNDGEISTNGEFAFVIRIRDSTTGVYVDPNDPTQIRVFNPQTLELTGNIDVSEAPIFTDVPGALVQTAVIRGDDVFLTMNGGDGPLLDNYTMIRGSISSGTFGEQFNSNTGPTFAFNPLHRLTDEQGNLWVHHTGNLSPTPFGGITGGILKIPAGSNEFDPNYDFRVTLDPFLLLQSLRAFQYYQNGIAFAHIGLETPTAIVEILNSVNGNVADLSPQQIDEILVLLNTSENGGWVELDLNAQTVKKIPGLPQLSPFAVTNCYYVDGIPHFPIVNNSGENALYRYDPATSQSEVVFTATGADLTAIIDLSANNLK